MGATDLKLAYFSIILIQKPPFGGPVGAKGLEPLTFSV
jgi:hypothetical protein